MLFYPNDKQAGEKVEKEKSKSIRCDNVWVTKLNYPIFTQLL